MSTRSRKKASHQGRAKPSFPISVNSRTDSSSDLTVENNSSETVSAEDTQRLLCQLVQNHLILEHISGFLSVSDLKQFRLVCRQWNQESLPILRKRVCCYLTKLYMRKLLLRHSRNPILGSDSLDNYEYLIKHGKKLILLLNSSTLGFPCVDFGITTEFLEINPRFFYNLLETISSFAVKLKLNFDHLNKNLIQMSGMQFPQLRTLNLTQNGVSNFQSEDMLKCFQHMAQNAPLVNDLHLSVHSYDMMLMGDYLSALETSLFCQNLNALRIGDEMRDEYLLRLQRMGLKLQKLSILLNATSTMSPEAITEFLQSQRNSLQELSLEKWGFGSKSEITLIFPRMEKLKVLSLKVSQVQLPGLCFATQFPVLKSLVLGSRFVVSNDLRKILGNRMLPQETLESLVIAVGIDNLDVLKAVGNVFPKLKKLEVNGPLEKIPNVGKLLENLEELTLQLVATNFVKKAMNYFTQFMTGYSLTEVETLEEKWKKDGKLEMETEKNPDEFFQQLKVLRIIKGKFTDAVCLLGPMKLGSLQCLDLRQSPDSPVSQRVLEQMRKKFRVLITDKCVISNE